ncbi:MAG: prepilin peptidase [Alphaproteobacteria bacterium]|nr:prepilin peptidase [Alphaproteobacteria bacterium]
MSYLLSNIMLFFCLMGLSLKDFKEGRLPDICLFFLALLGLLRFGFNNIISILFLGIIAYLLYKMYPLIKRQEGLGLGDVKMMGVSGIWLPLSQVPLFLIIAGVAGVFIALLWRRLNKGIRFPLGPALALALGICIVGDQGFSKGENIMTMTFSGPSLPPFSGEKPDSLVVLIHGYGADGKDLLSLGKVWQSLLPHTVFIAPHAPVICELNPSGKQWFGLKDWDPSRILKEIQSITPAFNRYLDDLLKTYNLPPEKLALVGFSQGAMLAIHMALHRPACAGVVAYSGAFLNDPRELKIARPPMLLIHGTEDQVLSSAASQAGEETLKSLGVPVKLMLLPGLDHGIDERGLGMGGAFLKDHLYKNEPSDLWKQAKESNN